MTDLFDLETRVSAARTELEKAALRSIASLHYYADENPHVDAEAEYSGEVLALAARDLVRAVEALLAGKRPIGWDVEVPA
jgi:hypothetical protein